MRAIGTAESGNRVQVMVDLDSALTIAKLWRLLECKSDGGGTWVMHPLHGFQVRGVRLDSPFIILVSFSFSFFTQEWGLEKLGLSMNGMEIDG